jgi:hypothetical protein
LYEYTPMQVKQALTGYGKADKHQIQSVVTSLLGLKEIPKPDDCADALAIALCHGFSSRFGELFAVGNMTRAKGQNTAPASAYQALMQEGERRSKKSNKGFSSALAAETLQKATGISGVTGVGRAQTVKTVAPNKQTTGAGTRSSVQDLAKSVVQQSEK